MLNFKREYISIEDFRNLYPTSFKNKDNCYVYGRKEIITDANSKELTAHSFLIPKDFWTFNAGQIDFTMYPDGIWKDYVSISIVERETYAATHINFGSMGDITPENLQALSDGLIEHISNLEKRIVESYMYIDEGVADITGLPNLPENHFWVKKEGSIVGVNLKYLKDDYEYYKKELAEIFKDISDKVYEEITEKMMSYYEELILKLAQEIKVLSEEAIKDIKEKINIYFEVDVKDSISEYVRQKEVEILEFIEANKANLKGEKGDSVSGIELAEELSVGNRYDIFIESGKKVGEILAPRGPQGETIVGPPGPQGNTGVVLTIDSQFAFTVSEEGHLLLHHIEGATPPNFTINENGHLILNL